LAGFQHENRWSLCILTTVVSVDAVSLSHRVPALHYNEQLYIIEPLRHTKTSCTRLMS